MNEQDKPTHRHKKRGTEYVLIGYGKMQAEKWRSHPFGQDTTSSYDAPVDMREVAIYRSVDDGSLWVRPREEFEDGRFELLDATTKGAHYGELDDWVHEQAPRPAISDAMVEAHTYSTLREANIARQAAWCPDQLPDLSFRGVELAGEVGEVCNVIKKLERERLGWRGSRDTVAHLAEELADVVICADLCANAAGIDLDAAVEAKFNATSEKVDLPHRLYLSAPAGTVKVKPLEFIAARHNDNTMHRADCILGTYRVWTFHGAASWFWRGPADGPGPVSRSVGSLDDGVAAAQADYEARILSAIEPTPSRNDVLEEAARDVLAERERQKSDEGWTAEHDDAHRSGELAQAAAAYSFYTTEGYADQPAAELLFPVTWDAEWWKPSRDARRNLVKAGALILAEIERLDRAALKDKTP